MRHRRCSVWPRPQGWQACCTALPYIFLPPFFSCSARLLGTLLRSERWGTRPSNAIHVGETPGRRAERSCAVKSDWISCGYCLQSDAARLLRYHSAAAVRLPPCDCRRASWRSTWDLISVLLCSSWWDFAIKSGLFSYKQTSITAPLPHTPSQSNFLNADLFDHWLWNFFDRLFFFFPRVQRENASFVEHCGNFYLRVKDCCLYTRFKALVRY